MNNGDALKALQDYYDTKNPTADDEFKFTEALGYLIEETKNPKYMTELGWYYCSKKRFDLEIKYLEMAAEYGYLPAMEELGYMWYYGQHGEKDYDKAFYYFSKGAE
jgi:TPR repeat protein